MRTFKLAAALVMALGILSPAFAAGGGALTFTFKEAESKVEKGSVTVNGVNIDYVRRYVALRGTLVNASNDKTVTELEGVFAIDYDLVDAATGKVARQGSFSYTMEKKTLSSSFALKPGGTMDFSIGVPYPEDLQGQEQYELRVTHAAMAFAGEAATEKSAALPEKIPEMPLHRDAHPAKLVETKSEWECRVSARTEISLETVTRSQLEDLSWGEARQLRAPFGNVTVDEGWAKEVVSLPRSPWAESTQLHLKKNFTVTDAEAVTALRVNATADNGFIIYLNGREAARKYAEGFKGEDSKVAWEDGITWEYSLALDPALLVKGDNLIEVFALDGGGKTYFEMELAAQEK